MNGAVLDEHDGVAAMSCFDRQVDLGDKIWTPKLLLLKDRLVGYEIGVERFAYAELRQTALGKFGPPMKREVREYSTKAGGRATGEVLTWRWPDGGQAELHECFARVDQALLLVTAPGYGQAMKRAQDERVEKAKKSFKGGEPMRTLVLAAAILVAGGLAGC